MERREDVVAYVRRPWATLEQARHAHWSAENRRRPGATMRASIALWQQMRALRPSWPSPVERRADLDHHRRLRDLLDRAAAEKPAR